MDGLSDEVNAVTLCCWTEFGMVREGYDGLERAWHRIGSAWLLLFAFRGEWSLGRWQCCYRFMNTGSFPSDMSM